MATPTAYQHHAISDPAGGALATVSAALVKVLPAPPDGSVSWNTLVFTNDGANPAMIVLSDNGTTELAVIARVPALSSLSLDHLNITNAVYMRRVGASDVGSFYAHAHHNAARR